MFGNKEKIERLRDSISSELDQLKVRVNEINYCVSINRDNNTVHKSAIERTLNELYKGKTAEAISNGKKDLFKVEYVEIRSDGIFLCTGWDEDCHSFMKRVNIKDALIQ